ncbi:MAG TPA: hypothetical protein P5228_09355 [Bacteroidales bacterium]|nr:hypothetical protein [Bacteroidales bacterium]HRZ49606.1 hypothetical protein [Bacteroidales bacterium]
MKKHLIAGFFLSFAFTGFSQQVLFNDTLRFDTGFPAYLSIDTTQPDNRWQVGAPSKTLFNSAWSAPNALVTDTLDVFPPGNISSFTLHLAPDSNMFFGCIGDGWITFRHRYAFDSLLAGGYIDIRYNEYFTGQWTPWVNVALDSLPIFANPDPDYIAGDTIPGGIPAYTGSSWGWKLASFEWLWMIGVKGDPGDVFTDKLELRFTANSVEAQDSTQGWMIDDLTIYLRECMGNVEEATAGSFSSQAAPNPGNADIRILMDEPLSETAEISVFGRNGSLLERLHVQAGEPIVLKTSLYPSGQYTYRVVTRSGKTSSGRFVKI